MNNSLPLSLANSWVTYVKFVANSLSTNKTGTKDALAKWQDKLFATLIVYIIPLSISLVSVCIAIEVKMAHYSPAIFDLSAVALVVILMLNRRISLANKRLILLTAAVCFSLVSLMVFGYYNIGGIYLFGISIFIAYQFSTFHAYSSVVGNFIIWAFIGVCMYYQVEWMPIDVSLEHLLIFISNLLFLNLITVIIIRKTLVNFDRSRVKESMFLSRLKTELEEVAQLNNKLAESEAQYKTLFFLSPLPKLIYDLQLMKIVQVNNAAVDAYGYTETELLNMSIVELTSIADINNPLQDLHKDMDESTSSSIFRQLLKKGGDVCHVDLKWASILYKGKPCRIVIASDITERVNHLEEIKHQNKKLKEIAYIQAHVIRSPLTKIMALSDLIRNEFHQFEDEPIFINLRTSTQELDEVIHEIIQHSEKVLAE